eukprot:TRINITY_DN59177_c0_g1_i1.p1 TRINITY_DN59177_c0_g1~~TRINITY_DN59177_c0_g1_i1.p1  ORF type:complete len:342 (-),score=47.83 TRINITY_DN59177_c0_g1_i1:145-1170(-)
MASTQPLVSKDPEAIPAAHVLSVNELQASMKCKTFTIAVLLVVTYWFVGFSFGVRYAGWDLVDSVYFVAVTITTVGYGDLSFMSASKYKGRIFGGCYVFVGVVFIAVAMGKILDVLQERSQRLLRTMLTSEQKAMAEGYPPACFDLKRELWKVYGRAAKCSIWIAATIAVGTLTMSHMEGWSLGDAFYFSCVTMTTVGYGDLHPSSRSSKVFVTVYCLLSFGVLASCLSVVGSIPFEVRRIHMTAEVLGQFGAALDDGELRSICTSPSVQRLKTAKEGAGASCVSRAEFVIWQLVKQGKLDLDDDVQPCLSRFDKLDKDGSGNLDSMDIARIVDAKVASQK